MEKMYVVKNGMVCVLAGIETNDIALKQLRLVTAAESRDFGDKLFSLVLRNEDRGLYCVHQNFQFRQLKAAVSDPVAVLMPLKLAHDFITLLPKELHIFADSSPLTGNTHLTQTSADFACGDWVVFVCILLQKLHELEELDFLMVIGHTFTPLQFSLSVISYMSSIA